MMGSLEEKEPILTEQLELEVYSACYELTSDFLANYVVTDQEFSCLHTTLFSQPQKIASRVFSLWSFNLLSHTYFTYVQTGRWFCWLKIEHPPLCKQTRQKGSFVSKEATANVILSPYSYLPNKRAANLINILKNPTK